VSVLVYLPHFWWEIQTTCVASNHVSFEDLLAHELEMVQSIEHNDLVIHRLTGQPLPCITLSPLFNMHQLHTCQLEQQTVNGSIMWKSSGSGILYSQKHQAYLYYPQTFHGHFSPFLLTLLGLIPGRTKRNLKTSLIPSHSSFLHLTRLLVSRRSRLTVRSLASLQQPHTDEHVSNSRHALQHTVSQMPSLPKPSRFSQALKICRTAHFNGLVYLKAKR